MTIEDMAELTKYEQPVKQTHKVLYIALAQYDHNQAYWCHLYSSHSRSEIDDMLANYSAGIRRVRIYPVSLPIGDSD